MNDRESFAKPWPARVPACMDKSVFGEREIEREGERERERETHTHRKKERERDTHTQKERERETHTHTEKERERERKRIFLERTRVLCKTMAGARLSLRGQE